ncbi:hypothetical protein Aconfl_24290 [Algoriphagus confluentis]|uniref:Uncharacterized protein n=2 Tax=Algoriphagus confluentis TaxID=1697556 RepID=A0ABQ6PPC2_9BACT|nr:hypothetical protein Aconfl_24290 [Algoriphagus confluentis]
MSDLSMGKVSLVTINPVLTSNSPIGGRVTTFSPFIDGQINPLCTSLPLFFLPNIPSPVVRVFSIHDLANGGGHRILINNPTNEELTQIIVSQGSTILFSGLSVPERSALFLVIPTKSNTVVQWRRPNGNISSQAFSLNNIKQNCSEEEFDPFCSQLNSFVIQTKSNQANPFVESVHDIPGLGHRIRIVNPTSVPIQNLTVSIEGISETIDGIQVPAKTEFWFIIPYKGSGSLDVEFFQSGIGEVEIRGIQLNNEVQNCIPPVECEMPGNFLHQVPSVFNVFFIPTNGGKTLFFENVIPGQREFSIPLEEYNVIVTSYSDGNPETFDDFFRLPDYSQEFYLVGSSVIDYSKTKSGVVTLQNPYSAILVVKNNNVAGVPQLEGKPLFSSPDYFYIYSKVVGEERLQIIDLFNRDQTQVVDFVENQQYRYILCIGSPSGRGILYFEDVSQITFLPE